MYREIDPSKYSTRLIALKFAYLGQRYNGFEHHTKNLTPLPTIEEELWKALSKARLIFPTETSTSNAEEINWEGCEYSKCGRTDKGVSAFGQVIGIRVRSNRPRRHRDQEMEEVRNAGREVRAKQQSDIISQSNRVDLASAPNEDVVLATPDDPLPILDDNTRPFHDIEDELPYPLILNRLLPEDIRILAWCPTPPSDFSARFSCRERRYKYFFTQPAFAPLPGSQGFPVNQRHGQRRREGWLDIEAMRQGARHFVGLHDFRNFCKVDASKQLTTFERRVFHTDIEAVDPKSGPAGYIGNSDFQIFDKAGKTDSLPKPTSSETALSTPQVYAFTVHGSGFLWHQVRCMVAILFLIGQGLESPDIIPTLLDIKKSPEKPKYEMADDAPLVLWDCIFPREGADSREDALEWVYVGDQGGKENRTATVFGKGKYGMGGVVDDLWRVWRRRKIDEVLAGMLLDVAVKQGGSDDDSQGNASEQRDAKTKSISQKVFEGGNAARLAGRYRPVLQRPRMESVEVLNAKYAARKPESATGRMNRSSRQGALRETNSAA